VVEEENTRSNTESASILNAISLASEGVKVLSPVNVWVDPRSASVIEPVGRVAVVPPVPVVRVTASVPVTAKLPARDKVPVVQVGAPDDPETSA